MSNRDANAFAYSNVGVDIGVDREGAAYGFLNVGVEAIATRQGAAFGYGNIGAQTVTFAASDPIESWGSLTSGQHRLVIDSRLDGNAYGYDNVVAPVITSMMMGSTNIDGPGFTTTAFTRVAGVRYFAAIATGSDVWTPAGPTSLTQTGLTWTLVNSTPALQSLHLSLWTAVAASSGNNTMTASYAATQHSFVWHVIKAENVLSIVQSAVATGTPPSGTYVNAPLAALQAGSGVLNIGLRAASGDNQQPTAGFTVIGQLGETQPSLYLKSAWTGTPPATAGYVQTAGGIALVVLAAELQ